MQGPADPAPTARCAVHPGRPADAGVCSRCGSFMCDACRVPTAHGPLCAPCRTRLFEDPKLRHVQPLAVVMMVHGGLLAVGGMFVLAYGLAIGGALGAMPDPAPDSAHRTHLVEAVILWTMVGEGVLHLAVGALQGWAGWRIRQFRGRGLAFAALCAGLVTVVGCYCLPTSLGLMIWGMVVLLDSAVAQHFAGDGS